MADTGFLTREQVARLAEGAAETLPTPDYLVWHHERLRASTKAERVAMRVAAREAVRKWAVQQRVTEDLNVEGENG